MVECKDNKLCPVMSKPVPMPEFFIQHVSYITEPYHFVEVFCRKDGCAWWNVTQECCNVTLEI